MNNMKKEVHITRNNLKAKLKDWVLYSSFCLLIKFFVGGLGGYVC